VRWIKYRESIADVMESVKQKHIEKLDELDVLISHQDNYQLPFYNGQHRNVEIIKNYLGYPRKTKASPNIVI
jgi:hypothetical protein